MTSKDFAIGVLSTTATILLVGLFVIHTRPEPAYAAGMTTTNGDYVLTVGTATINNEELLYIIDAPQEILVSYRFNSGKRTVEIVDRIKLSQMRSASGNPPPQQKGKKGRTGKRRRP